MDKQFVKHAAIVLATMVLSFGIGFAIPQVTAAETTIQTVQEAEAILKGQAIDETGTADSGNAGSGVAAGDAADESAETMTQEDTEEIPQGGGQPEGEAGNGAPQQAQEGEIWFDWSFEDWTYNGLHISAGVEAVAASLGLDPSKESDNIEHEQYGYIWYGDLGQTIRINDQRVCYEKFKQDNGGTNLRIYRGGAEIYDAGGSPKDVSDLTGVPLVVGTLEEFDAIFHMQEIMEKGEVISTQTYEGKEYFKYEITSNLGVVQMDTGWGMITEGEGAGKTGETYSFSIRQDGVNYQVRISPDGDNGMYYAMYSYHSSN